MKKITVELLRRTGKAVPCDAEMEAFEAKFPQGATPSLANIRWCVENLNTEWFIGNWMRDESYSVRLNRKFVAQARKIDALRKKRNRELEKLGKVFWGTNPRSPKEYDRYFSKRHKIQNFWQKQTNRITAEYDRWERDEQIKVIHTFFQKRNK